MHSSSLRILGFLAAALPALTIHACLLASAAEGFLELCNPYWADCVSVSRTGRHGLGYFLFKAGMIPSTLMLGVFWQRYAIELHSIWGIRYTPVIVVGWAASLSLFIYSLALGHTGDAFYLLRRFGVVLFVALTFIVQVKLGQALAAIPGLAQRGKNSLRFSAVILFIAIGSLVLDAWLGGNYDRIENAFEWWLIMLLIVHLAYFAAAHKQLELKNGSTS